MYSLFLVGVYCPNDPKLSHGRAWRGGCAVGGKAVVEAADVTCTPVGCSAWLGFAFIVASFPVLGATAQALPVPQHSSCLRHPVARRLILARSSSVVLAGHRRTRPESSVLECCQNRSWEVKPNDPKLSDSGPGTRMGAARRKAKARAVPGFMAGRTARD